MWAQQEQRSPGRLVSGAGSLKSPGKFEKPGQEGWGRFFSKAASKGLPRPFDAAGWLARLEERNGRTCLKLRNNPMFPRLLRRRQSMTRHWLPTSRSRRMTMRRLKLRSQISPSPRSTMMMNLRMKMKIWRTKFL